MGEPAENEEEKKEESKVQIDEQKLKEAAEILGLSSIKYYDLR
jgi:hypothetical protein